MIRSKWVQSASMTGLFTLLTAAMTWPQVRVLTTHAVDHHDVYFNLWRLRWIAHALATSPQRLFDGNVFYPDRLVLTLSDAMLAEGVLAAPLFWIGLPPVLVHNLMLLGAIVASGVGAFVLARHLSASRVGGIVAGIVFAFAPYRFEHYMHMELQWAVWLPWAFWALQRTLETGAWKFGALTGAFVALQMLSSIYYGLFLALLLPVVAIAQLIGRPKREVLVRVQCLALGALIAACAGAAYATPYSRMADRVGHRSDGEVRAYSAKPRDYLVATSSNWLYGGRSRGQPERRLFPGWLPPLLALIGLLLVRPPAASIAYVIGGAVAFELSLGMYGRSYPILYEYAGLFQSLRAPARISIFCLLFLGVLAAYGCAAVLSAIGQPLVRRTVASGIVIMLLAEYWAAPIGLVPYHNEPPPLYDWLARQPSGVVAEFPMPTSSSQPGRDPMYSYMSTFHWKPLVNGYSGYYPPGYATQLDVFTGFPDPPALKKLRESGVSYLVVHTNAYGRDHLQSMLETLIQVGAAHLGEFDDGFGRATVFRMR